jgi:2-amino-4-hydroxy-6-hydroxymethyldihydropteridine diphosphokinase
VTRGVAAIALGSNLGDREGHLRFAVERLGRLLTGLRVSSFRETAPVGVAGPPFLNAAAVGATDLDPPALLAALLALEAERGRIRPFHGAPRPLDLDLVLWGDRVVDQPDLVVPHPRFRERRFVLEPLAEIAPGARHPRLGRTAAELLAACPDRAEVRRILPPGAWFEVPGRFR